MTGFRLLGVSTITLLVSLSVFPPTPCAGQDPVSPAEQSGEPETTKAGPRQHLLDAEIKRLTAIDPDSPTRHRVSSVRRVDHKTVRQLFPGWTFHQIAYRFETREGFQRPGALPLGLGYTFAVGPGDGQTLRLWHHGNYESFGTLLTAAETTISDEKNARLVWTAFCHLHKKAWAGYGLKRMSDTEWKLGIYSYEQTVSVADGVKTIVKRTHYYWVTTDAETARVMSWKSFVDTSDERFEPTE